MMFLPFFFLEKKLFSNKPKKISQMANQETQTKYGPNKKTQAEMIKAKESEKTQTDPTKKNKLFILL